MNPNFQEQHHRISHRPLQKFMNPQSIPSPKCPSPNSSTRRLYYTHPAAIALPNPPIDAAALSHASRRQWPAAQSGCYFHRIEKPRKKRSRAGGGRPARIGGMSNRETGAGSGGSFPIFAGSQRRRRSRAAIFYLAAIRA